MSHLISKSSNMKKITKDQAISKIRSTDPLEISYISIQRDDPDSVKRQKLKAMIDILQSYVNEVRPVHLVAIKEK
jgi:hypothetical protein